MSALRYDIAAQTSLTPQTPILEMLRTSRRRVHLARRLLEERYPGFPEKVVVARAAEARISQAIRYLERKHGATPAKRQLRSLAREGEMLLCAPSHDGRPDSD